MTSRSEVWIMETANAILINRHRLTETSLIVHWSSADLGLFKTVAKGALRPKSSFAGRLDLFITSEVAFTRAKISDLHTLKEVQVIEPRRQLRDTYARVLAATYFCKLVEMVAERETPLGTVHELLTLSLDYLDSHDPSSLLVQRYENKLCSDLGLGVLERGAAILLQDVFHHPLPPQRDLLLKEIKRLEAKERN